MPRNRWSLGVISLVLALTVVGAGATLRPQPAVGKPAQQATSVPTQTAITTTIAPTTRTAIATLTATAPVTSTATTVPTSTATTIPPPSATATSVATPSVTATPGVPGVRVVWSFAAKFMCGSVPPGQEQAAPQPLEPGSYATEINIYNPHSLGRVDIRKQVLLLVDRGEPVGREPRSVRPRLSEALALGDNAATMDDCARLWQMLYPSTPAPTPMPPLVGFLVILSPVSLDVVSVTSVSGSSVEREATGIALTQTVVEGKRVLAPAAVFPADALPRPEDVAREQALGSQQ